MKELGLSLIYRVMISVENTIAPIRLYKVYWTTQKLNTKTNEIKILGIPNESVDFIFSSHN